MNYLAFTLLLFVVVSNALILICIFNLGYEIIKYTNKTIKELKKDINYKSDNFDSVLFTAYVVMLILSIAFIVVYNSYFVQIFNEQKVLKL